MCLGVCVFRGIIHDLQLCVWTANYRQLPTLAFNSIYQNSTHVEYERPLLIRHSFIHRIHLFIRLIVFPITLLMMREFLSQLQVGKCKL